MPDNTVQPEGRCPQCHHIRGLHNGRMVLHHYTGTIECEGSYLLPLAARPIPPMTVADFNDGGDY
jgi:hypothetical protein